MTVKRYTFEATCCLGMEDQVKVCEDAFGEYVTFEDYDILCGQYDTLKDKYDRLMEKVGDIWREG